VFEGGYVLGPSRLEQPFPMHCTSHFDRRMVCPDGDGNFALRPAASGRLQGDFHIGGRGYLRGR